MFGSQYYVESILELQSCRPALLLDDSAPLEAFKGQRDARFSPFMRSFAKDVGGSPAEKMNQIPAKVKDRYVRTKMHQIFDLVRDQFDSVVKEVGSHVSQCPHSHAPHCALFPPHALCVVQVGGDPAWVPMTFCGILCSNFLQTPHGRSESRAERSSPTSFPWSTWTSL